MFERFKTGLLIASLLANVAALIFIGLLVFTSTLDLPLAAYSHYKNCERDFASVLAYADKLPPEQRPQAKQLFSSIVCQKNYQTGQPLTQQDFNTMLKELQQQVPAPTPAPAPTQ